MSDKQISFLILKALQHILWQNDYLERKLDQIMSTQNTLAEQLQAAADAIQAQELQIETTLAKLAQDQDTAFKDLKNWIVANGASAINPASVDQLQKIAAKFGAVNTTLGQLDAAATGADPGPVPIVFGSLAGKITDSATANPISGATVSSEGVSVTSGPDGSYTFSQLPVGNNVSVTASMAGYADSVTTVNITSGVVVSLDLSMVANP